MSSLIVKKFSDVKNAEMIWDRFIEDVSINGTFLQTRNFLNYHPDDRFIDDSLFVYDKGKIAAVIPACQIEEDGKCFFSHKGSTFGGPVISKKYYNSERMLEILDLIEQYAKDNGYKKIVLKPANALFAKESPDLLHYCLGYRNYTIDNELSTYVDILKCADDIKDDFDRNKVRNIFKCEKYNLTFREVGSYDEIRDFYNLLSMNLDKFGIKPIHTIEEIIEFKKHRIPDKVKFYGVYDGDIMKAGGMLFIFSETNVLHAQNLSADYTFKEYSPVTYLYHKLIEQARKDGFNKLSWGISTEERGKVLNESLLRNKESYGSRYCINNIYEKNMMSSI